MIDIYDVKNFFNRKGLEYENVDNCTIRFIDHNPKYNFNYLVIIHVNNLGAQILFNTGILFQNINSQIYKVVNKLNIENQFFKFIIKEPRDRDDSYAIFFGYDFILTDDYKVDLLLDAVSRGMNLLEEIYPDVQRQIWR